MISTDIAALIGFACESVLYGTFVVIFTLSLAFLSWRRRTHAMSWPMIFSTCLLFTLCTVHYALEFNHFYNRLLAVGVSRFGDETIPLFVSDIFVSLIDFVGDLVILYRCWMVWGQNTWVIITPFLTSLAGFICAMIGLSLVLKIDPSAPIAPPSVVPLGTASFALPLATNFIVTALIVGRIYYLGSYNRDLQSTSVITHTANHVSQVVVIVIESGVLYLVFQLILVVLFALKHPSQGIISAMAVQIYGIAPTLISFRVGLGIAPEHLSLTTKRSWANRDKSRVTTYAHQISTDGSATNVDSEYGVSNPTAVVQLEMTKLTRSETTNGGLESDKGADWC